MTRKCKLNRCCFVSVCRRIFQPQAHREAAHCPYAIPGEELARRTDLRDLPIVTIDGENARDFDDAVFVQQA